MTVESVSMIPPMDSGIVKWNCLATGAFSHDSSSGSASRNGRDSASAMTVSATTGSVIATLPQKKPVNPAFTKIGAREAVTRIRAIVPMLESPLFFSL